jgi:hypothetical protein
MAPVSKGGGTEFGPAALERAEARLWRDLWDAAPPAVAAEHGIAVAAFGPLQATVAGRERSSAMNLLLGAAEPGVADEGFLAEAVEWSRERGARVYAPLTPGRLGFESTERWLRQNDFEPAGAWLRFIRDAHPPRFPAPGGVEVVAADDPDWEANGLGASFGSTIAFKLRIPNWTSALFAALPGRPKWRCYAAETRRGSASAAVYIDGDIALLAIDSTAEPPEESNTRAALLHRFIEEAGAAGATTLAARIDQRGDDPPHHGAAGLLLAGFREAYRCPGWIDARLPAS